MIYDKISNWKLYFKNPVFKSIFEELKSFNINTPNGEYKNNEDYYFKVMSYDTKEESLIVESHEKEVDIQILLFGNEQIKLYDSNSVEITKKYDLVTDCQFYKPIKNPHTILNLTPEYMAVFFPQDIHHPQFLVNNIETLKKIVIKVNEKFFS